MYNSVLPSAPGFAKLIDLAGAKETCNQTMEQFDPTSNAYQMSAALIRLLPKTRLQPGSKRLATA